jgi:hypothetical protein
MFSLAKMLTDHDNLRLFGKGAFFTRTFSDTPPISQSCPSCLKLLYFFYQNLNSYFKSNFHNRLSMLIKFLKINIILYKILDNLKFFFADWLGLKKLINFTKKKKALVFFAESSSDWTYLNPVANYLEEMGFVIARVTSDRNDIVLLLKNSFYIGYKSARTIFFRIINVDIFVMTLTDLDSFYLKRSKYPVKYFYIFHSIASMHRVYRKNALDAYDVIFCVGPHHISEIRKTELFYGLKPKVLVEHGYGRLDTLIHDLSSTSVKPQPQFFNNKDNIRILVAPTWGESSLISHNLLIPIINTLLDAQFEVVLRLHPMVIRDQSDTALNIINLFSNHPNFIFDSNISSTHSLISSDTLISEWSGAALEYSFALERPVIFIDTPPKTFNPDYAKIELPCLEEEIRSKLGLIVSPNSFDELPNKIIALIRDRDLWRVQIQKLRQESIYHVGSSGEVGAKYIAEWLEKNT